MMEARGAKVRNRIGEKWRCYMNVGNVIGQGRLSQIIKCLECGVEGIAVYSKTINAYTPLPCLCGNRSWGMKYSVGDVVRNKKILEFVDQRTPAGNTCRRIRVQCLRCGAESIIQSQLFYMNTGKARPGLYCKECQKKAKLKELVGQQFGTWLVKKADRNFVESECVDCGYAFKRKRCGFHDLKRKYCPKCLKENRKITREKIILVLRQEGFTLESIATYFNVTRERIRQIEFKVKENKS